jgi:MoxR-like ATPase
MTIKDVKEQIKSTVRVYLKKDEYGEYRIPTASQRPIFLIGPPGIGKTAIMEQVAQEMDIAIVSYSMTHHTRQSALGLPIIEKKIFGGREYTVCEYSMSEIIGSVYETIEQSGIKEGILFLDEINCISETLMPSMLQFLQFKRFGKHQIPPGWIIVTAGNPPEYNRSVREFDIVTLDRLKVIEVDSDYAAWKEYAQSKGIHKIIISYLDTHKNDFYDVEVSSAGKSYVTARGWEDLSQMLFLLEEEQLQVDENLIIQYIRSRDIAKEFALFYELYKKHSQLYDIEDMLKGNISDSLTAQLKKAKFDERIAVVNIILDKISAEVETVMNYESVLTILMPLLKQIENECGQGTDCATAIDRKIFNQNEALKKAVSANNLSKEKREQIKAVEYLLHTLKKAVLLSGEEERSAPFEIIRSEFNQLSIHLKEKAAVVSQRMNASLSMIETLFGEGQEMLLAVTELTANPKSAKFISNYGCSLYYKYNECLLLDHREKQIDAEIEALAL